MTQPTRMRESTQGSAGLGYIAGLDGFRAFAVTAVIVGHSMPSIARGGAAGVDMFFVLSGFLITRILRAELKATTTLNLRNFYIRRALRLTPALWTLVLCYVLFSAFQTFLGVGPGMWNVLKSSLAAVTYVMNWVRAFHLGPEAGLGHTWSLAVEEQFYILWPLILLTMYRYIPGAMRLVIACLALASFGLNAWLTASGHDTFRIYNGFDTRSGELMVGCFLAFVDIGPIARNFLITWPVPVMFLFYAIFGPIPHVMWIHTWLIWAMDLAAGWCILALVHWKDHPRNFMESRGIVWVGRVSYGMYLWHYPIGLMAGERLSEPLTLVVTFCGSLVLASASFILIERPFLSLKNRFEPFPARREETAAT